VDLLTIDKFEELLQQIAVCSSQPLLHHSIPDIDCSRLMGSFVALVADVVELTYEACDLHRQVELVNDVLLKFEETAGTTKIFP